MRHKILYTARTLIVLGLALQASVTLRALELFELSSTTVAQGQVILVQLHVESDEQLLGLWVFGRTLPDYPLVPDLINQRIAYLAVGPDQKPGTYAVLAKVETSLGQQSYKKTFLVKSGEFPSQTIKLTTKKSKELVRSSAVGTEAELFATIFSRRSDLAVYQGAFLQPVEAPISSVFGAKRVYDDGSIGWQHKGVDLAAGAGTPIKAANAGQVCLARTLQVHGNTVVIDHGHGIFTVYNHLQELMVNEQDLLSKSQIIGKVGMTGLATGPHLHFGLSVNNVRVDPLQWADHGPL